MRQKVRLRGYQRGVSKLLRFVRWGMMEYENFVAKEQNRRYNAMMELKSEPTADNLWNALLCFQDYEFSTVKGLKFKYTIKGGEIFVDRKGKSITRATAEEAFKRVLEAARANMPNMPDSGMFPVMFKGPKKLGVFGASYLFPIFIELGIIV